MADERIIPFSNGSQYMDWTYRNCDRCRKQAPTEVSLDEIPCEIERALIWAMVDDGKIPLPIAERMKLDKRAYTWPCGEFEAGEQQR